MIVPRRRLDKSPSYPLNPSCASGPEPAKRARDREAQQGQIALDFLFGITLFLFTFTYVSLFIPGLFAPFESESDVTTLQGDKIAIWLTEDKLVDDKSEPNVVNQTKLFDLLDELNGTDAQKTQLREEAGLVSSVRRLDLNVTVDWLNGTVNASGNETRSDVPVGQTRRVVRVVNTSLNESEMADHVVIHEVFASDAADAVVLFNPTKDPVDLRNWVLGDGEQNLTFPNLTYIAPRGFLTIVRGTASSFASGCTPDLEVRQTGSSGTATVPKMVNLTGGTSGANSFFLSSAIPSTDEVCLFNNQTLVDAVNMGAGDGDKCNVGAGLALKTTETISPAAGQSIRRINPGVEGGDDSGETGEDWSTAFASVAPACPVNFAVVSVRVW